MCLTPPSAAAAKAYTATSLLAALGTYVVHTPALLVRNAWRGRLLLLLLHLQQLLVAARLVQEIRLARGGDPAQLEGIPCCGPRACGHTQLGHRLDVRIEELGLLDAEKVGVHQPLLLALHLLQSHLELEPACLVKARRSHLVQQCSHARDGEDQPRDGEEAEQRGVERDHVHFDLDVFEHLLARRDDDHVRDLPEEVDEPEEGLVGDDVGEDTRGDDCEDQRGESVPHHDRMHLVVAVVVVSGPHAATPTSREVRTAQPLVPREHDVGEEVGEDEAVVAELVEGGGRGAARDADHVCNPTRCVQSRVVAARVARSPPCEVTLDDGVVEGEPIHDDGDHAPHDVGEDLEAEEEGEELVLIVHGEDAQHVDEPCRARDTEGYP
mmetsp:Transcript_50990/g.122538  ORF Transcript_50990/g.122538 Transcript_50990/m.122538 type:complete len:382 (-) Transcript_50990:890-2035(-)